MKIEHIGLWVHDLEKIKEFYRTYFNAESGDLYHNKKTGFRSYFLTFDSGSRLEIMSKDGLSEHSENIYGYAHLALTVGGKEDVDILAKRLVEDGFLLTSGPRTTGDGYYEAVIKDPEGNLIEITAE